MCINLPEKVDYILKKLQKQGFEAYAVGGCVRDALLGREPEDWDITTSARPEQVKEIFRRTIDTGIQHGTVTVMMEKEGFEVTTYRIDGEYDDSRHPKSVQFTGDLIEDLKRRDFTINAMAYNKEEGLVDVFDGAKDLRNGMLRCVGSPIERFSEDALRMLRAVRFAGQLDFVIEEETKQAIIKLSSGLGKISAERIRVELDKLLCSRKPEHLLTASELGITSIVLPEFDRMLATQQNHPHHQYNVGVHTLKAIEYVHEQKEELMFGKRTLSLLSWTALLHDIGKPDTRTVDEEGIDHFYLHVPKSREMAKNILKRLRWDNHTIDTVCRLVQYHDVCFSKKKGKMRHLMNGIGVEFMPYLFIIMKADILAQSMYMREEKLQNLQQAQRMYEEIQSAGDPVSLKMLDINGIDLQEAGFPKGKLLGEILNGLLECVMEKPELNQRETLLALAKDGWGERKEK
ncbi:MAG: CCA tRNA nucleotidyltransferase [Lachnospiraceae bacterium]|nr:CCA tRNA nucleotidyltransferase [Lachnospiraceae bacterium]